MIPFDTPADLEALEAWCNPAAKVVSPDKPEAKAVAKSAQLDQPKQRVGRKADPNSTLPRVFDSINQCSSVCGIPVPALRAAKKAGCPAFRHSRVDLIEFLKWRFGLPEDAVEDWGAKLSEYKARREKLRLEEDEKRVIDRCVVTGGIAKGTAILFGELEKSIQTLPPALKGLTESEIQSRLIQTVDVYRQAVRLALSEITKQPVSVDTQRQ
jgi:hypothetical protein